MSQAHGAVAALAFGAGQSASLGGVWDFFPGDGSIEDLEGREPDTITVPGLWEGQGFLELDGVAWYRRRFALESADGHWTLRFGAVMDLADVYLNGVLLGRHEGPFTPFELDPTEAIWDGANTLAVRVTDPPLEDRELHRLPHGKQGWANHVFPSPPSLYMTYGGIWQPVTLRQHGPVAVRDVFVNGDPAALTATIELENVGPSAVDARLTLCTLGLEYKREVELSSGARVRVRVDLGPTQAERWSPARPALHDASVSVSLDGLASDATRVRYGLRSIRVEGSRIVIGGEPYRMKSALVQGFWADSLYAEPGRGAIEAEVRAARAMGLNTLRLHIKAFDPAYLEVCDELGMLLHCDIPVAEPIDHEDLGADTETARNCIAEARGQVRRDRNHPSIVLWSAMNELGWERQESRAWPGYEAFARALVGAIEDEDPTRPVIENDWPHPDPERVFATPVLTAHWYGRLHTDYLEQLERQAVEWADSGRPLYVTEFGDWGLPEMPRRERSPFWYQRDDYERALQASPWCGSLEDFLLATQRYQGLSDRLQAEVFRRHDHLGGYCVTELTDVPHELNGALDLDRRPKPDAVKELTRANQPTLPMLALTTFSVVAGCALRPPVYVANDRDTQAEVELEIQLGGSRETRSVGTLRGHAVSALGELELEAPAEAGEYSLLLRLVAAGRLTAENDYPLTVLARPRAEHAVCLLGSGHTADALAALGARLGEAGPIIVAEGALDAVSGAAAASALEAGETVLMLAQQPGASSHYPVPATLREVATEWGPSMFHYTTDHGALPSLPRRTLLTTEDASIKPLHELTELDGGWAAETVVAAFKPLPWLLHSTVVGVHPVGRGRLIVCQYRLAGRACGGDPLARAVLADLVGLAAGEGG